MKKKEEEKNKFYFLKNLDIEKMTNKEIVNILEQFLKIQKSDTWFFNWDFLGLVPVCVLPKLKKFLKDLPITESDQIELLKSKIIRTQGPFPSPANVKLYISELIQAYTTTKKQYDVFISYAHKDKSNFTDSLYKTISELKIKIFYDSGTLKWGDTLIDNILDGIENSEFAIIVITENFFGRKWTTMELDKIKQQQKNKHTILPILYDITIEDIKKKYKKLYLDDIVFIEAKSDKNDEGLEEKDIAILLANRLIERYKINLFVS